MDEMTYYEVTDILENIPYLDRNLWESSRLNAYINAQTHSKKKLDFSDICKFKWDDDGILQTTEISKNDIERLEARAKQIEAMLKK